MIQNAGFYLISGIRTFTFFFAIAMLISVIFFGFLRGFQEEADLDRRLESYSINTLHNDPESMYGQNITIQGIISEKEKSDDPLNGTNWIVVGGLGSNNTPVRVSVEQWDYTIRKGTVVRVEGICIPDPDKPGHLAIEADAIQVIPVGRFSVGEMVLSTFAMAAVVGMFFTIIGGYWEWLYSRQHPVVDGNTTGISSPERDAESARGSDHMGQGLRNGDD